MKKFWVFVFIVLSISFVLYGFESQKNDAKAIVKKIDELYRSNSSIATIEMEIITPNWERTLKMDTWSEGMDKFFIRILEPKKEKGIATLRIENELWNYLPRSNKVIKIPPSMMMSPWMGSDFTYDDLVKEYTLLEDYHFDFTSVENPEKDMLYIKCRPKEGRPIVWGHLIIAVREKDYIPVWEEYYDEKETLIRKMFFKEVKAFGEREVPSIMELIPLKDEEHRTVIRYLEARFDVPVEKDIFTLRNLRSKF